MKRCFVVGALVLVGCAERAAAPPTATVTPVASSSASPVVVDESPKQKETARNTPPPDPPTDEPAPAPEETPGTGHLPPADIAAAVKPNVRKVRLCYERALGRDPSLKGKIVVKLVIGPDGAVTSASDNGSTMPDAEVVRCVLSTFKTVRFKPPSGGGSVTVTYPFVFEPSP